MSNIIFHTSRVIVKDNQIKRSNYKSTCNKMYQIASCSKFITSIVVAILYEQGKLDYDTDINTYLKKWKCPQKKITLRLLLSHTSGSSDGNGYLGMEPQVPYYNHKSSLKQDLHSTTDIISGKSYSKPFNITEKPNSKFKYSGAGYQVVQQILEEVTEEPLYKLMYNYIFKPLGMKNSTGKLLYEGKHKYNIIDMDYLYRMYPETAAAGVWMSCNDLLLLLNDLMDGFNDNKSKLLKQSTIILITEGEHPEWEKQFGNFGLGPFINKSYNGNKLFAHEGINYAYQMHFHCIPKEKYIEITMLNHNPKIHDNSIWKTSKNVLNNSKIRKKTIKKRK